MSPHAEKVNMRDAPAGYIITAVANGIAVNPLKDALLNGTPYLLLAIDEKWLASINESLLSFAT